MNSHSEKKLIVCCRNGDKSAYAGLVRAYCGRVFAICLGMLGNTHDAEDIAQQALLKGFTDIGELRDSEQFGAWISRIAKNLCIDFIRRQKRRRNALLRRAATNVNSSNDCRGLEAALAKLPQEYRVGLMLYYFDGRSTKNIAETLAISEAAVHARLSRARKKLRELLSAPGGS
ncbi:MAG: RNA polymerase sigma factor [Planctomycetota bacterium]